MQKGPRSKVSKIPWSYMQEIVVVQTHIVDKIWNCPSKPLKRARTAEKFQSEKVTTKLLLAALAAVSIQCCPCSDTAHTSGSCEKTGRVDS